MYKYEDEKPILNTEAGQKALLNYCLTAQKLTITQKRFSFHELTSAATAYLPSNWSQLAVVDRLIELGYLRIVNRGEYETLYASVG